MGQNTQERSRSVCSNEWTEIPKLSLLPNVLNRLNKFCFKRYTQTWGKSCITISTQAGNKNTHTHTHKNKVVNCPHTVTKCHQEPMLSLTWHLIICLQSDSWQAPPSEPSVWLCCVSSHQPQRQALCRGEDKSFVERRFALYVPPPYWSC